jgi:hypothetical protein
MKLLNDVLEKYKGKGNADKTICGKNAFSKQLFEEIIHGLVNDTTYQVEYLDKKGNVVKQNLSEPFRESILKNNTTRAKYPQKSELAVYDNLEINTKSIADISLHAIDLLLSCGKKVDLPSKKDRNGSIYLAKVPKKEKTMSVRDIKTKENLGTTTIKTEEYVQIRSKSPVPKHLQTKVRRDINGKIITK